MHTTTRALSTLSQRMQRRLLAGSGAVELLAAALAAELRAPPAAAPLVSCTRLVPIAQDAAHVRHFTANVGDRQGWDVAPALPTDGEPERTPPTIHACPHTNTPPHAPVGTAGCRGEDAPSTCTSSATPAPMPLAAATLAHAVLGTITYQREDAPSACASSAPMAPSPLPLAAALLRALAEASACRCCTGIMLASGALPLATSALAVARLRDPATPAALELVCALLALNHNPKPLPAQGTMHGTTRSAVAEISVTPEAASPAHADPGPEDPPVSADADCAGSERVSVAVLHCGASGTALKTPAPCPEPTRRLAGALVRLIRDALLHGGRAADAALRNRALQLACQLASGSGGPTFCRGVPYESIGTPLQTTSGWWWALSSIPHCAHEISTSAWESFREYNMALYSNAECPPGKDRLKSMSSPWNPWNGNKFSGACWH